MLYAVPVWACYAATEAVPLAVSQIETIKRTVRVSKEYNYFVVMCISHCCYWLRNLTLLLSPSFDFFSRQKQVNSTERTWLLCGVTHTQVYSESPLFSVFFMNQLNFPSEIRIKHWSLLSPWAFPLYLFLSFISSAFQPVHVKESCKFLPKIARVQTWARANIRIGMMNP